MQNDVILITGASGLVSSELVRILKSDGYPVKTTTSHKTHAKGTEKVYLDLVTGEGINSAFDGVNKAFLLSPPGYADQYAILVRLIHEAKKRALKKVVLITVLGTQAEPDSPFRRAELELEKSGLDYNIIRPNWFMQNFHTYWLHGIKEQNEISLPAGNLKVSFIDARDISAVAAKLLITDNFAKKTFDLTGPESFDHLEIARMISEVAHKSVNYKEITPQQFKENLLKAQMPSDYIDYLNTVFTLLRKGYHTNISTSVKDILGVNPRKINNYIQDFKHTWI